VLCWPQKDQCMEHFVDLLSKKLATTTSRRGLLAITSRTAFAAFVTSSGIGRLWGQIVSSAPKATAGSSRCGAVQKSVQLSVGDYGAAQYGTIRDYIAAVDLRVDHALDAHLIDRKCALCITNEFVREIPVEQQASCGPLVPPTSACGKLSREHVHAAAILSFSAAPDAWGDGNQWLLWITLTQEILGCQFVSGSSTSTVESFKAIATTGTAVAADSATCAQPGVNYCGPGNSANPNIPGTGQFLPKVAPCLNNACCNHDNCYAAECAPGVCYFTPQNAACDAPLVAACMGDDGCSSGLVTSCGIDPLCILSTVAVCGVVICATRAPTKLCKEIQLARLLVSPQCASPCNGSCCAAGTDCVTTVTSVPGAIKGICCSPGATACGTTCCAPPATCQNDSCTCPTGQPPCGATCCAAGQTCSSGQCTSSGCPAGSTRCGPATPINNGCCPDTTKCCSGFGVFGCIPPDFTCCPNVAAVDACPPGDTCVMGSTGGICCTSGQFGCLSGQGTVTANSCCPIGSVCCPGSGFQNACCFPGATVCCSDLVGQGFCIGDTNTCP
jgi:hypothetical protein